jgi:hypothetical protein
VGGGGDEPPSSTASSSLSKFRNLGSTVAKAWLSLQNSGPNTAEGSGMDSRRGDGSWGGVPPPAPTDDASALARASARKASVSENQSNEKRHDDDGAWGGGAACLCLCLWGICQSQVVTVKVKRLSMEGDPSPSKRAGANLNPRLTLALVHADSPIAPRGGTARPALHPEGEGNAHRTPAINLWDHRRRGRGRGRGWYRSASHRWPSSNV